MMNQQRRESRQRRQEVITFLFNNYFDKDISKFRQKTGYTFGQLDAWLNGRRAPRVETLDYIMGCIFCPEFQIVCEFTELDPEDPLRTQLAESLGEHTNEPGIYAFYDSRAQLLYLGKATRLLQEVYDALKRPDEIRFPAGVRNQKVRRWDLVSYYSAYHVPESSLLDYPKHVESLMLRISKPPLNKQIGRLEKVKRPDI